MTIPTPTPRAPRHRTMILLSREAWQVARDLAEEAALRDGGKPSVTAAIEQLLLDAGARRETTRK